MQTREEKDGIHSWSHLDGFRDILSGRTSAINYSMKRGTRHSCVLIELQQAVDMCHYDSTYIMDMGIQNTS